MADHASDAILPLELVRQIDAICAKFETALRAGRTPDPGRLLKQVPAAARTTLLRELLLLELEYCPRAARAPVMARWDQRFPEYVEAIEAARGMATLHNLLDRSAPEEPPTAGPRPELETTTFGAVPSAASTQGPESSGADVTDFVFASDDQEGPARLLGGRYQLRGIVGEGAFGKVYRAYDPKLEREVALKVPRFAAKDREEIKRFLTEAKAAARLRHPNIVAVFDCGEAEGMFYIAAEFVPGEPLSTRLARERPTFAQAARWVRDLALALAYAHGEGIVHRDIKPANIMIDGRQRPQLTDFGLAKLRAEGATRASREIALGAVPAGETASMTVTGAILGTPAYMAPEQARGDGKAVGPHSDQYSLGAVLYELLTGRRPFERMMQGAFPLEAVLQEIATAAPPPPRRLKPKIPRNLEAICLKAMAKEPADRYADAAELAVDLQLWLKEEPIQARPFNVRERAVRWSRRNPKLAIGVGMAVLCAVASFFLVAFQLFQAKANLGDLSRQARLLECDLCRERGQRLGLQQNAREGVLYLARAFEIAALEGDADRESSSAAALFSWADKIPLRTDETEASRRLWNMAAAMLLGVGLPTDEKSAACWLGGDAELLGLPMVRTQVGHENAYYEAVSNTRKEKCRIDETVLNSKNPQVVANRKGNTRPGFMGTGFLPTALANRFEFGDTLVLSDDERMALAWTKTDAYLLKVELTHPSPGHLEYSYAETAKEFGQPLHQASIEGAVFSRDGKLVLTWGANLASLWQTSSGAPMGPAMWHPYRVSNALFGPVGVVTIHEKGVRWWPNPPTFLPTARRVEGVRFWIQAVTGMRLVPWSGEGRGTTLDAEGLADCFRQFRELIGQVQRK